MPNYLPELDLEAALKRLSSKALFTRLLGKCDLNAMAEDVYSDDPAVATDAAHAVKGLSSNLSLNVVFECAKDVEAALKSGTDASAEKAAFKQAVENTNAVIDRFLADNT